MCARSSLAATLRLGLSGGRGAAGRPRADGCGRSLIPALPDLHVHLLARDDGRWLPGAELRDSLSRLAEAYVR